MLRREQPKAFGGTYEPVDLGPGVCAYARGSEVLVGVATRPDTEPMIPDGWRDLLGLPGFLLGVRADWGLRSRAVRKPPRDHPHPSRMSCPGLVRRMNQARALCPRSAL